MTNVAANCEVKTFNIRLRVTVKENVEGVLRELFDHEIVSAILPSEGVLTALLEEQDIDATVIVVDSAYKAE